MCRFVGTALGIVGLASFGSGADLGPKSAIVGRILTSSQGPCTKLQSYPCLADSTETIWSFLCDDAPVGLDAGSVCSYRGSEPLYPYHTGVSAELQWPRTFVKDPAGNIRFRTGFCTKARPNQAQTIRHGTHKPAHIDSERLWADFGVFRRRSETCKL